MADKKISQLTSATTPLAGTEVLPIVQSGSTVKVAVSDLTAGRAVSAGQLNVDNLRLDANTISSTNTDGAVTIAPNGIGAINLTTSDKVLISNSTTTADAIVSAAGTQTNIVAAADRGPAVSLWNTQNTDGTFSTLDFLKSNGLSVSKIAVQTASQAGRTGYISMMTADGAAPAERLTVNNTGDVNVKTGNLVVGTAGKGIQDGSSVDRVSIASAATVINESGADIDFRVEGDTNQNLIFADASADSVGFGTSSPVGRVYINGKDTTSVGDRDTATLVLNNFNGTDSNRVNAILLGGENGNTNSASYIAFKYTSAVGNGYGDLLFGTRSVTTDTAPTQRLKIPAAGGVVVGNAALATTATAGFLYVPTCAGTPTGTPDSQTGTAPIVIDTTNNKLYFYSNGQWRDAGP